MKKILSSIAAGVLLAGLVAAQPERRYTVIDLGTLGGAYSNGFGINTLGDVAGVAATPAQTDGFAATATLWSKQKGKIGPTNLGVLGPPHFPACPTCNSGAAAVDAFGGVAMGSEIGTLDPNGEDFGQWDPPNPTHRITRGAIWRNGAMTLLPNLPGGNNANVFWANNPGQLSGFAENGTFDSSCSQVTPFQVQRFQPVIWKPNGEIQRVLSPLTGDTVAFALTINDLGETVGASGLCATTGLPPASISNSSATHAVLWGADGSVTDLGSLGGAANIASSINNLGEVVGTAQSPKDGTVHTFLWTRRTEMLDYGSFPGAVATVAGCCHTINDSGEIVGFTIEPTNPYFGRAVIWQGTQAKDLNTFVLEPGPFVQLTGAFSISDSGEIVCQGVTTAGEIHACLAVPNIGATADEIVSPLAWQFGTYVPLTYDAREWLRRRAGMPLR